MDDLKLTVTRLHDMITETLEDPAQRRHAELGLQLREQVVRLLRRKDLRISVEVLLHDLRNVFSGFETFDPNNRRQTMEHALQIIENLDVLIAGDQALNADRIELPPPPPVVAEVIGDKEKKVRQEARSQLDRLRAERNKHRPVRRPQPPPPPRHVKKGPGEAEPAKEGVNREHLVFNVGDARNEPAKPRETPEGSRGPRPPREAEKPGAAAPPHHQNEPGGGRRKHWRGRRRPQRPKT
jgi:hypothetical protein